MTGRTVARSSSAVIVEPDSKNLSLDSSMDASHILGDVSFGEKLSRHVYQLALLHFLAQMSSCGLHGN